MCGSRNHLRPDEQHHTVVQYSGVSSRALSSGSFYLRTGDEIAGILGGERFAPYKGVEDLLRALATFLREDDRYTLILVGGVKDRSCEPYWAALESLIETLQLSKYVRQEMRHIPDGEVSRLVRTADVAVLPYWRIDQSGVLTLGYAQGVPVIVSDAGALREDVIDGETGLVFRSGDVLDLAASYGHTLRGVCLTTSRREVRRFECTGSKYFRGREMLNSPVWCTSTSYRSDLDWTL